MVNSSDVGVLERLLQHFHVLARELERQIEFEEVSTKVSDPNRPDYSLFAASARMRRENLLASISRLEMELHVARRESSMTGGEEPKKNAEPRDQTKSLQSRSAQAMLSPRRFAALISRTPTQTRRYRRPQ
jgi:hypothetical protein